eukprot:TRINITY_DN3045_c0_g3_i2.p1 TRINITY_DN3045_c0_g3~~TRINITY_DN3045_c0_g3_i2.p1  ORF type:complete len:653 (-),score=112.50 TRINITY_DN3045_c0_g3_i2:151-2109(-)
MLRTRFLAILLGLALVVVDDCVANDECSTDTDFGILYSGVTAFSVSHANGTCACRGNLETAGSGVFASGVRVTGTGLNVTGPTRFDGNLVVAGSLNVQGTSFFAQQVTASGGLSVSAGLSALGGVVVSGGIAVSSGGLLVSGGVNVTGSSRFVGSLQADSVTSGTLSVTGTSSFAQQVTALGGLSVSSGLSASGGVAVSGGIAVSSGGLLVSGGVNVTGSSRFAGSLQADYITSNSVSVTGGNITFTGGGTVLRACTAGNFNARRSDGHCYMAFSAPLTFWAAYRQCEALGAHMATLTTPEENQFVASSIITPNYASLSNLAAGYGSVWGPWIGLTDTVIEGQMTFITGEQSVPDNGAPWNNFVPNEPNNAGTSMNAAPTYYTGASGGGYVIVGPIGPSVLPYSTTQPITLELWFKPVGTVGRAQLASALGTGVPNSGYHASEMELTAAGALSARFWGFGATGNVLAGTAAWNAWNHGVASYDGSTMTVFLNGVQGGSRTGLREPPNPVYYSFGAGDCQSTTAAGTPCQGFVDGSNPGNGYAAFKGYLDEIRIWAVARSAAQIQSTSTCGYTSTCVGTEYGLVAYYRLNEGSGITLADSSRNGITASAKDGTWAATEGPVLNGEDCVCATQYGLWNDLACSIPLSYICERDW